MEVDNFDEYVQREFNLARSKIRGVFGLELKLSELVALRRITRWSAEVSLVSEPPHDFNPSSDAAHIFMDKYYDAPISTQKELSSFTALKRKLRIERGYDAFAEFFQLKQDRAYLI
jgi:hypothetical protein